MTPSPGSSPSKLSVPFSARGHGGAVTVVASINDDPGEVGCPEWARGFPVCHATVDFDGHGYAALFGWVQLVRMGTPGDRASRVWVADPLEVYADLNTPFGFHGVRPELFDGPARSDRSRPLDWFAESYLCHAPSKPMAREAQPVAAFSWGFVLQEEAITMTEPSRLPLASWDHHRDRLTAQFPTWAFLSPNAS